MESTTTQQGQSATAAAERTELAELRCRLVARLQEATELADHAKEMLAKPYTNAAEWTQILAERRGYQRGLAWGIEELDRLAEERA